MKRKEFFYINTKEKKIKRGKEYKYNTLIINTNRLKWDENYKEKCIKRFQEILNKRKEVKPIRINYNKKRKYFSDSVNHKTRGEYTSRIEVKIIQENENTEKQMKVIKMLLNK